MVNIILNVESSRAVPELLDAFLNEEIPEWGLGWFKPSVSKGLKFYIYPSSAQEAELLRYCSVARSVYNQYIFQTLNKEESIKKAMELDGFVQGSDEWKEEYRSRLKENPIDGLKTLRTHNIHATKSAGGLDLGYTGESVPSKVSDGAIQAAKTTLDSRFSAAVSCDRLSYRGNDNTFTISNKMEVGENGELRSVNLGLDLDRMTLNLPNVRKDGHLVDPVGTLRLHGKYRSVKNDIHNLRDYLKHTGLQNVCCAVTIKHLPSGKWTVSLVFKPDANLEENPLVTHRTSMPVKEFIDTHFNGNPRYVGIDASLQQFYVDSDGNNQESLVKELHRMQAKLEGLQSFKDHKVDLKMELEGRIYSKRWAPDSWTEAMFGKGVKFNPNNPEHVAARELWITENNKQAFNPKNPDHWALKNHIRSEKSIKELSLKITRKHEEIAEFKKSRINEIVHDLVSRYDVLVLEELDMKDMSRRKSGEEKAAKTTEAAKQNHGKSVGTIARSEFVDVLKRVALREGKIIIMADKYFPSSQKCSNCGEVNPEAKDYIGKQEWTCPICGHTHNRDINAAINLREYGRSYIANHPDYTVDELARPSLDMSPVEVYDKTMNTLLGSYACIKDAAENHGFSEAEVRKLCLRNRTNRQKENGKVSAYKGQVFIFKEDTPA